MYGKQQDWETWGAGHMSNMDDEMKSLGDLLPTGRKLSADHQNIIKAKLPDRLAKVRDAMRCPPHPLKPLEQHVELIRGGYTSLPSCRMEYCPS